LAVVLDLPRRQHVALHPEGVAAASRADRRLADRQDMAAALERELEHLSCVRQSRAGSASEPSYTSAVPSPISRVYTPAGLPSASTSRGLKRRVHESFSSAGDVAAGARVGVAFAVGARTSGSVHHLGAVAPGAARPCRHATAPRRRQPRPPSRGTFDQRYGDRAHRTTRCHELRADVTSSTASSRSARASLGGVRRHGAARRQRSDPRRPRASDFQRGFEQVGHWRAVTPSNASGRPTDGVRPPRCVSSARCLPAVRRLRLHTRVLAHRPIGAGLLGLLRTAVAGWRDLSRGIASG
jgi:hypothetical protein